MKYFTKELWRQFQTKNWRRANAEWDRRYHLYRAQLQRLKSRLSPSAKQFFKRPLVLHDGTLVSCSIGEFQHRRLSELLPNPHTKRKLTVHLVVADDRLRARLHSLRYSGIRKVLLNFPSEEPLFVRTGEERIDDWGYDELTSARKDYLQHEILFASGATILIEFRSLTYRTERITPKRKQSRNAARKRWVLAMN